MCIKSVILRSSLLLLGLTSAAYAAESTVAPGTISPGQISNSLRESRAILNTQRSTSPLPAVRGGALPSAVVPKLKHPLFLRTVVVHGVSAYSPAIVTAWSQPYVGKKVNEQDLQALVEHINQQYAQDGFLLTTAVIPQQSFQGGKLIIQVYESHIVSVATEGDLKRVQPRLLAYGAELKQYHPLPYKVLSHYTLLANQIPGATVQTVLKPTNTPGAYDLVFTGEQKRFIPYAGINNNSSTFYGRNLFYAGAVVNSLFRTGDSTTVQGTTAETYDKLHYFGASHSTPIGLHGDYIQLNSDFTHTHPGDVLSPADLLGDSENYEVTFHHPLRLQADEKWWLWLGMNAYDSTNSQAGQLILKNNIRSIKAGTTYEFSRSATASNMLDFSVAQGLNAFGASQYTNPSTGLPTAATDYSKVNITASRLQDLFANFSLLLTSLGQYGFNHIPVEEQVAYGGRGFGRAYDPGEIIGDSGVNGAVEIRYDDFYHYKQLNKMQYFTYYDAGVVWNRGEGTIASDSASGTSAGGGIRFFFTDKIFAAIELDVPLTRAVSAEVLQGNNGKAPRLFFSFDANL